MPLVVKRAISEPPDDQAALALQTEVAREVRLGDRFKHVCGVTLAYDADETTAHVVAVVLGTTTWSVVHSQRAVVALGPPRAPGLENFREAPAMLEVLARLVLEPDVIFVDGHGIAHPRKFGVASHVGVSLDLPTVGVSDVWPSGCSGRPSALHRSRRGTHAAIRLSLNGDVVGSDVCTQAEEPTVYVSPGHRVDVDGAVALLLRASPWHRLPEPLHVARTLARAARDEASSG